MKSYKVVNNEGIQLMDGPFAGITYQYGRVELNPDEQNDILTLSFEYDIIYGQTPDNIEEFKQYIGDILQEIILEQLTKNEVVYINGVD